VKAYRSARAAWAELATQARPVYMSDITVGELPQLRGHWLDRLPAMDLDIAAMAEKLAHASNRAPDARAAGAIRETLGRPHRTTVECRHIPPTRFAAGKPLEIEMSLEKKPASVRLYYRHVNQAERYEVVEMQQADTRHRANIPQAYTDTEYPLEYYFEVQLTAGSAILYPGLGADLTQRPYFVVRRA
jgi:hypothetical protein